MFGITAGTPKFRVFGPKTEDHPSVGTLCRACNKPFEPGEYTTLVPLGPGDSDEAQERARTGKAYNAVAIEVHFACATGHEVSAVEMGKLQGDREATP